MASRRVWTWPTRGEPGSQGIQTPKFVLVASQELENTQEPAKEKPLEPETPSTRLRKLSHSLGLESLYILFQEVQGHVFTEQKKIAILGDMRSACLVSLLHILPTTASVFLFIWNWRGYYIGSELSGPSGEDGLKFLGLQVAAKMLELLSMASLSTILFALVRKQLVSNSLPFGAVTAGFEFTKLSLLWSKEFVATCASDVTKFSSTSSKAILITTIVVFTLLGAAIGPSAAVASQPVLRNWPAGGTTFWLNATSQDLWPTQLDKMSPSDIPCNYSQSASCFPLNYNLLAGGSLSHWPSPTEHSEDGGAYLQVIPERVLISGRQSMITLATRFRGPFIYEPELTVSTAPLSTISDALSQYARYWFIANQINCIKKKESFCYYNDIFHSIDAIQPITYVKCSQSNVDAPINFPRLDQGSGKYPQILYNNTILGSRQWFDNSTSNGTSPALAWAQLPEADFGNSSVGAVVALPSSSTGIPDQVFGCTVDARWANATSTVSFLGSPEVASGLPTNWFLGGQRQLRHDGQPLWPQIKLGPEWGNSINPSIENSSKSVFATLCNSVGRLSDISLAPPPINAVEAVLTVMITDGLSRTSSMATILGSLKDLNSEGWINEILPKHSVFGSGGSAFNYSYQGGDQSTKLEAKTTVNGYGYGITTATALSTFVLLIYSVIAIVYVFYSIIFTQTTSSSWESIAELVALALNSGPTSAMQNTSAGIATLGTLKQSVKVRVKDEHLQMVFEEGKDREGDHKIAADGYYG